MPARPLSVCLWLRRAPLPVHGQHYLFKIQVRIVINDAELGDSQVRCEFSFGNTAKIMNGYAAGMILVRVRLANAPSRRMDNQVQSRLVMIILPGFKCDKIVKYMLLIVN
jgi:hypothetical protein